MQATIEQEECLHETSHVTSAVEDYINAMGHYQVETPIEICDDCELVLEELLV